MKAAFVMWRGGYEDHAETLAGAAPQSRRGPYKFGVPTRRWGGKTHPEFDVVDYIFVRDWHDASDHFIAWDEPVPAAGS